MKEELNIVMKILETLETHSTHIRVVRGFGVGHPYFDSEEPRPLGNRTGLGDSKYALEDEDDDSIDPSKVKVSRAFESYE